jgi:hypothetical protein
MKEGDTMPKKKTTTDVPDVFTPERLAEANRANMPARSPEPPSQQIPQPAARLLPRQHPALPPVDLVDRYDTTLGDLIRSAWAAVEDARRANLDAEQSADGGLLYGEAVAEERAHVLAALADTGDPPDDLDGPLMTFIVKTRRRLTVKAARSTVVADWADAQVRQYPGLNALRQHLDELSDATSAEMGALFARAEKEKDRRPYLDAKELCKRWAEETSLYVWTGTPGSAYVARPGSMVPKEQGWAEYQADLACGGPERPTVLPPEMQASLEESFGSRAR